ncbi:uncharacterized protein [Ptychodera flava]|uniref:uncharacterized protein n=1 Tax=Ptychodera flava TaxID=63121 RepID=UPI00396A7F89
MIIVEEITVLQCETSRMAKCEGFTWTLVTLLLFNSLLLVTVTASNDEDNHNTDSVLQPKTSEDLPVKDESVDTEIWNTSKESNGSRLQLPRFQQVELEYYVKHASQSPFCVLFKDNDTSTLEVVLQEMQHSDRFLHISKFQIQVGLYSVNKKLHGSSIEVISPTLRCYLSSASFYDYDGSAVTSAITDWLKMTFSKRDTMISEACHSNIDEMISSSRITVLAYPGHDSYKDVEYILQQLKSNGKNEDVQFLIVPTNSAHEKPLVSRFKIEKYPTVLMLDGTDWKKGSIRVYKRLQKSEVRKEIIELHITTMKTSLQKVSLVNFQKEVMEGKTQRSPIILCFFAAWGKNVNGYMSVFDRTASTFSSTGAHIRFGIVDIKEESKIIPRYVKVISAKNVPFIVVFWWSTGDEQKDGKLLQKVFSETLPTPSNVYEFLQSNNIPFVNKDGKQLHYTSWSSSTDPVHISYGYSSVSPVCSCHDNTTDMSREEERFYYPSHVKKTFAESDQCEDISIIKDQRRDNQGDNQVLTPREMLPGKPQESLKVLTDLTWRQVMESSSKNPMGTPQSMKTSVTRAVLVIFIQSGCGTCERRIETFQNIALSVSYLDGGSVYLVNCTNSPIICEEQSIVGFPTLIAYRKLGWLESEKCVSPRLRSHYSRLDYHGSLVVDEIMEWFSQAAVPSVNHADHSDLHNTTMIEDIRIIGTVYPKSVAGKYLPRIAGVDSWYPMQCFQLLCERLYGKAVCYAEKTQDIPSREFHSDEEDEEMVVTQVKMLRRDGIEVLLFKLGVPLISTLEDETNNQIHEFHTPHKYDLKAGQRCEDDHAACSDVLADFVEDHRRLPVSHLTLRSFHTSSKWMNRGTRPTDLFKGSLPIIIALVHKENVTEESEFRKVLTSVAYALYNKVIVATLDVDEFRRGQLSLYLWNTEDGS